MPPPIMISEMGLCSRSICILPYVVVIISACIVVCATMHYNFNIDITRVPRVLSSIPKLDMLVADSPLISASVQPKFYC